MSCRVVLMSLPASHSAASEPTRAGVTRYVYVKCALVGYARSQASPEPDAADQDDNVIRALVQFFGAQRVLMICYAGGLPETMSCPYGGSKGGARNVQRAPVQ